MKKIKSSEYRVWRNLTNLWTVVTIVLFIVDFFSAGRFDSQASGVGIIYIAILGIYAGTKEFDRWQNTHTSRYAGEYFILTWTVLVIIFAVLAPFSQGALHLPSEFIATYIAVLGVFALTRRSKSLHERRKR